MSRPTGRHVRIGIATSRNSSAGTSIQLSGLVRTEETSRTASHTMNPKNMNMKTIPKKILRPKPRQASAPGRISLGGRG